MNTPSRLNASSLDLRSSSCIGMRAATRAKPTSGPFDLETHRSHPAAGLGYGRSAKDGHPHFGQVAVIKILIELTRHNLSSARAKVLLRNRLSWMRFAGVGAPMPDRNTLRRVMDLFDGQLRPCCATDVRPDHGPAPRPSATGSATRVQRKPRSGWVKLRERCDQTKPPRRRGRAQTPDGRDRSAGKSDIGPQGRRADIGMPGTVTRQANTLVRCLGQRGHVRNTRHGRACLGAASSTGMTCSSRHPAVVAWKTMEGGRILRRRQSCFCTKV
ncbi:MAG: hypothetical protein ACI807_001608 [Paracoccaceae bacterium]|jgi:hypothetical protein